MLYSQKQHKILSNIVMQNNIRAFFFWFSIKGPQSKKYFYLFKKFYLPYSVIYLPGSLYRANLVPRFLF